MSAQNFRDPDLQAVWNWNEVREMAGERDALAARVQELEAALLEVDGFLNEYHWTPIERLKAVRDTLARAVLVSQEPT